ncbi:MAG: zinc-ribbon domain-containing protein [Chloroflexi bacterium]|nr:MAG: zinc-ribbon domain-containing protein [Chloroflexota bacterium]
MSNIVVIVCSNCHTKNEADAVFCTFCGTKIKDKPIVTPTEQLSEQGNVGTRTCPNCHKTNEGDATFTQR